MRRKLTVPDVADNFAAYCRQHSMGVFWVLQANDPLDSTMRLIIRNAEAKEDWWGHSLALTLSTMSRTQRARLAAIGCRAAWR